MPIYKEVKTIQQFKDNVLNRYVSYTYNYKLFNKLLECDFIRKHSNKELNKPKKLKIQDGLKTHITINELHEYDNKQRYDFMKQINAINTEKYQDKISYGSYILHEYPQDHEAYKICQITEIIQDKTQQTVHTTPNGYTICKNVIIGFKCKELKPFLTLQCRIKDTNEAINIYTYIHNVFKDDYQTYTYDDTVHDKYLFRYNSHIYFIPNFADHIYNDDDSDNE
jgi:hypothetical protein